MTDGYPNPQDKMAQSPDMQLNKMMQEPGFPQVDIGLGEGVTHVFIPYRPARTGP